MARQASVLDQGVFAKLVEGPHEHRQRTQDHDHAECQPDTDGQPDDGVLMQVSLGVNTRASLWTWLIGPLYCPEAGSMKYLYRTA